MNKTILKSIKFKLTFWYSTLLISLSLLFVLLINIVVTQFVSQPPVDYVPRHVRMRIEQIDNSGIARERFDDIVEQIRQADLQRIRTISVVFFLLLSIVSIGGGYLIADKMLSPIKKINKQIKDIKHDNLKSKLVEDSDDELGELITNFNEMIDRLNLSFEAQRDFVANASHELKTPLTVIKANLEQLKSEKINLETIDSIIQNADYMNKLIEELLLLSKLESVDVHFEKNNISEIINDVLKNLEFNIKNKKIKVNTNYKDGITLKVSTELFKIALRNILDNAIKYSNENSVIDVIAEQEDESIKVKIIDKGVGISEKELERIFEKFYRIDKSRSRKTGGTGLGLSIAKKIIELHGGKIEIKSIEGIGTEVILIMKIS